MFKINCFRFVQEVRESNNFPQCIKNLPSRTKLPAKTKTSNYLYY